VQPDGYSRLTNMQRIVRGQDAQARRENQAQAPYYWVKG
jgi:hypothetical protein